MRKKRLITIATLVAVIALTVSVPVFASGCGDDDVTNGGRLAQQTQDRDGDGNGDYYGGRGMMGRQGQGQDLDRDGICDQGEDCLGRGDGDCDGDCDGIECEGRGGAADGDCDGDCLNEQGVAEPLRF